jgi:hypothetical protein
MQDEKKVSQDLRPCLINFLQSTSQSSASQINGVNLPKSRGKLELFCFAESDGVFVIGWALSGCKKRPYQ